uniref:Peptide transporter PTR3-A n=1 Tax=Cajanus cajan TaxID=3821 RepID=A0A151QYB4_CAJCA|nr:Peptide transporter PTR3-A [Cajanus cajan]
MGYVWYSRELLTVESNLRKIYRICKAAFGKRKSKYPTSPSCYHWKGYKQGHLYERGKGKGLRLLPRVPRLFRWLDKAAIVEVEGEECGDHEVQEKNGNLCMVKEVREVKSLVPMIYLGFTFSAYSLLMATGNTFFVAQASIMKPVITKSNSNDISILFVIKTSVKAVLGSICITIIKTCEFRSSKKSKRKAGTIIRIGLGLVCAVICSLVAWKVEIHRLSINKEGHFKHAGGNTTRALVPQFSLLGMTEGFVDGGLSSLYRDQVAESLGSFEESFSGLFIGSGKLLIIPLVLIIRSWFKETVNTSRLDLYYLFMAILNAVFLLVFAYYSSRYAYKEEFPKEDPPYSEESSANQELAEVTANQISEKGNKDFFIFFLSFTYNRF